MQAGDGPSARPDSDLPVADRRGRRASRAGMTVLEITIAVTIVAVMLMGSTTAFMSSIQGVQNARKQSRGAVFLRTVMEDVAAQDYADLPSLNGDRILDDANAARATFAVDLTVFLAAVDLQQVEAELRDLRTNRVLGRVVTLRSRR